MMERMHQTLIQMSFFCTAQPRGTGNPLACKSSSQLVLLSARVEITLIAFPAMRWFGVVLFVNLSVTLQDCIVCQELFAVGNTVVRLPCGHLYHEVTIGT